MSEVSGDSVASSPEGTTEAPSLPENEVSQQGFPTETPLLSAERDSSQNAPMIGDTLFAERTPAAELDGSQNAPMIGDNLLSERAPAVPENAPDSPPLTEATNDPSGAFLEVPQGDSATDLEPSARDALGEDGALYSRSMGDNHSGDENAERSHITELGQRYIAEISGLGVQFHEPDEAEQHYLDANRVKGVTRFWGNTPQDTTVTLTPSANDATVYEEYLHVRAGEQRGWVGLTPPDNYIEEITVEQQVMARADELGMTPIERQELQQSIDGYYRALAEHSPELVQSIFGRDPNEFLGKK
jgi:hypothetical protein